MDWTPDEEDIPITIPDALLAFEELGRDRLNAMTRQELEDRLQEGAEASARNYRNEVSSANYDQCVLVVSEVLKRLGSSIETKAGGIIVAESESWARIGCRSVFPKEPTD